MIKSSQITQKIYENKITYYFEDTSTVIAEIDSNRNITYNSEFKQTLENSLVSSIEHTAKYFDDVYTIPGEDNFIKRVFNERPLELVNDETLVKFIDKKYNSGIFKILEYDYESGILYVESLDLTLIVNNVSINDVILIQPLPVKYYYITNGFIGNSLCFWSTTNQGYTTNFKLAKKFTQEEVFSILKDKKFRAYECNYIDSQTNAQILTIDSQLFSEDYHKYLIKNV